MIYFDHAATSYPKSLRTRRALMRTIKKAGGNPGRSGHALSLRASEEIFSARCALAELFGTEPECVIFTGGATHALNMALCCFGQGRRIFLSNLEHNAVYRTVRRLHRDAGNDFFLFPAQSTKMLEKDLQEGDLVVSIHASNVTGQVLPVERIGALCRERGALFILDAAQSAGHISVRFDETNAAAICVPGHKALGGLQGAGALLLDHPFPLPEFMMGGGGHAPSPFMPDWLPDRLEAGTLPTPAIVTMGRGAADLSKKRLIRRQTHLQKLCRLAEEGLRRFPAVRLLTDGDYRCGILSFTAEAFSSEEIATFLSEAGICVRGGLHCAPLAHKALGTEKTGCVRLSFGEGNRPWQVRRFLKVMAQFFQKRG